MKNGIVSCHGWKRQRSIRQRKGHKQRRPNQHTLSTIKTVCDWEDLFLLRPFEVVHMWLVCHVSLSPPSSLNKTKRWDEQVRLELKGFEKAASVMQRPLNSHSCLAEPKHLWPGCLQSFGRRWSCVYNVKVYSHRLIRSKDTAPSNSQWVEMDMSTLHGKGLKRTVTSRDKRVNSHPIIRRRHGVASRHITDMMVICLLACLLESLPLITCTDISTETPSRLLYYLCMYVVCWWVVERNAFIWLRSLNW
jgi:hypothetical protein